MKYFITGIIFIVVTVTVILAKPILYFIGSLLIDSGKSFLMSSAIYESTGDRLKIKKTERPYRDWNTGSSRVSTDYSIEFDGKKITEEALKSLINSKNENLVEYPTIHRATELKPNDLLAIISGSSQSSSYLLVRIQITKDLLQATIVPIGSKGSAYIYEMPSRLQGWIRVVGDNQSEYLISKETFEVVNVGIGEIAKIEYPYVFMVDGYANSKETEVRVVNIETRKVVIALSLEKKCFKFPKFLFSQSDSALGDGSYEIKFQDGPLWWDKNFDFTSHPIPSLKLKKDHAIASSPAESIRVVYNKNEVVPVVNKDPNEVQSADYFYADEIDQFFAALSECKNQNPQGRILSEKMTGDQVTVSPIDLCLSESISIDRVIKKKVCGPQKKELLFSKFKSTISKIDFEYFPLNNKTLKSTPITAFEVSLDNKDRFYSLKESNDSFENEIIKAVYILNETQVLLQARGSGPWKLYLLSASEVKPRIDRISEMAYPTPAPEVSFNFLYFRRARVLVQKDPFYLYENVSNLVSLKTNKLVTFYQKNEDLVEYNIWDLGKKSDPYEWSSSPLWSGSLPSKCLLKTKFKEASTDLKTSAEWFDNNILFADEPIGLIFKSSSDCKFSH